MGSKVGKQVQRPEKPGAFPDDFQESLTPVVGYWRSKSLARSIARTNGSGRSPRNETKFKKVEGSNGIFEFKSYQMRLYCFFDGGDLIICTNGAVKKRDRSDPADIVRAEEWKRLYFEAKATNTLIHLHGH